MTKLDSNSFHRTMFFHGNQRSRPVKKIDFMTGSERMLKAHHKNAVYTKCLEQKKSSYDQHCNKNLGKIQQEMYDVYFKEFIPLKEQASQTRTRFPDIDVDGRSTLIKQTTLQRRANVTLLPKIGSSSMTSLRREKIEACRVSNEDILNSLRRQHVERDKTGHGTVTMDDSGSVWLDNLSVIDEVPYIDEKRLQILKTAIALTSQPAVTPEPRKPRRLRKSFLISLRRQSKMVFEKDLLGRINIQTNKCTEVTDNKDSSVGDLNEDSDDKEEIPEVTTLKWKSSWSKNRILNADDDDDEDSIDFHFVDRARVSMTSLLSERSRRTSVRGAPIHDVDADLYESDSSPDIFSVISERTDDYSSYSDWTTSSGSDDSFYSSYSDEDY